MASDLLPADRRRVAGLLLKEATTAWRGQLREADVLARYGGEEFGIIVSGVAPDKALTIVDRLRTVTPRGQTFSAGLAEWTGAEGAQELVRRADQALYLAKAAGRDRIVLAGHDSPAAPVPPDHRRPRTVDALLTPVPHAPAVDDEPSA